MRTFGNTKDGRKVTLYSLKAGEYRADILDLGATLQALYVPDKNGEKQDVVLGFETPDAYLNPDNGYMGATVGRFANRIRKGHFSLNGQEYQLACNNGPNHLHGGLCGFSAKLFSARILSDQEICFSLVSSHMDEGFPGELQFSVTYLLNENGELSLTYQAVSDQDTVINFTNHAYFNLDGQSPKPDIRQHKLSLSSLAFCPCDDDALVTGEIRPVLGSEMDFTKETLLSDRLSQQTGAIARAGGIDHNFVLLPGCETAATLSSEKSGIRMTVKTDRPGIQVYSAGQAKAMTPGKCGAIYRPFCAICLETQSFPDSPNQPHFPSCLLKKGAVFTSKTVYRFSLQG